MFYFESPLAGNAEMYGRRDEGKTDTLSLTVKR
jgi:hypothetical protein